MSVRMVFWVAAGGAIGSVARYAVMVGMGRWLGAEFPYGTLAVNVVGSFVLGALVECFALVWNPPQEVRAMIVVGVLGAFTTFSTFSLDTYALYAKGAFGAAAVYVSASVVLSVLAFVAAIAAARALLA